MPFRREGGCGTSGDLGDRFLGDVLEARRALFRVEGGERGRFLGDGVVSSLGVRGLARGLERGLALCTTGLAVRAHLSANCSSCVASLCNDLTLFEHSSRYRFKTREEAMSPDDCTAISSAKAAESSLDSSTSFATDWWSCLSSVHDIPWEGGFFFMVAGLKKKNSPSRCRSPPGAPRTGRTTRRW